MQISGDGMMKGKIKTTYVCKECDSNQCTVECDYVPDGSSPDTCVYKSGHVQKWTEVVDISKLITEVESHGYSCIKNTRET